MPREPIDDVVSMLSAFSYRSPMNEKLSLLHREPTRRPGRLAPGGLVLLGLALAACGSHEASPPVAHVARSTGTTIAAAPTSAALLATRCLRQHGLPDLPGPVLATSARRGGR